MGHPITLFTCPRAFEGKIGTIQTNAVESWRRLEPAPEILFISDDPGMAGAAEALGCHYVPGVRSNEHGTPLVSDIFAKAQKAASHDIVSYINTDIVLPQSFVQAVGRIESHFDRFLMIGQRTDFYYPNPINFAKEDWSARFVRRAQKGGALHGPTGVDYHCFRRGMYERVPDFALGRRTWDNWLVWWALRQGIPVIDVTKVVCAVHVGKTTTKSITPEVRYNRQLGSHAGTWGRVNFATWALQPEHDYPGELFR